MNYTIDRESGIPAYLQLYRQLRDDIVKGVYPLGTKIPSKRLIKEETGLSLVTIEHALELLTDEGYIENRERSGCFVSYRKGDMLQTEEVIRKEAEPLTVGTEDRIPFSVLSRTVRSVLNDYGEEILDRTPGTGARVLREAIAGYLARNRGMTVSPDQIIIGSGSEYLYSLAIQILGRERIYGIEDPCYEKIANMYEANGIVTDPLKLGRHGILTSELNRTGASVLHVTPFNSYPSGISATASKKAQYLEFARKHRAYIIEDDYASELTVSSKAEETLFSMDEAGSVIYMNTFTATISPSFRTGYMILKGETLDLFKQKAGFYSCTVSALVQYVIAELILSGDFERHINRIRRKKRREQIEDRGKITN